MKLLTNWRNYVLLALALAAMVFLFCDPTATNVGKWFAEFAVTKLLALAFGYAYWRLFTYWDNRNELPEIKAIFCDL